MDLSFLEDLDNFKMDMTELSDGSVLLEIDWPEINASFSTKFEEASDALEWVYYRGVAVGLNS